MGKRNTSEDFVLIKDVLEGNIQAFGQLIEKHKNSIFNLAYRMTGSYQEAEDISQEAFIQAYEKIGEFKIGFKFHTWIYTIALNICKNRVKRKNILKFISLNKPVETKDDEVPMELPDRKDTLEEILIKREKNKKIREIIDSLPLKYRSIFLLKYADNMSYEEISQVTGLPKRTVEVRLYRAHKMLLKKAGLEES